jgi:hypothetical protein
MIEWPKDGCLICGRARNRWCDEYHLPVAEANLSTQKYELIAQEARLAAYKAAKVEAE